jgi:siroheme synthase-like protein
MEWPIEEQTMSLLPIFLKLGGRRCLLVGAGAVALDKIDSLLQNGTAASRRRSRGEGPRSGSWLAKASSNGLQRSFELPTSTATSGHRGHRFAASQRNWFIEGAVERGILCNSVDDIPNCDFFFGSVVSRGESCKLPSPPPEKVPPSPSDLRREIDEQLPADLGPWLEISAGCAARFSQPTPAAKAARLLLHQLAQRPVCESASCPSRQLALAPLTAKPIDADLQARSATMARAVPERFLRKHPRGVSIW